MMSDIWVVSNKKEEKFLRKKPADFDFKEFTKKEIAELISRMRRVMHAANGIGLSANQIGLDLNMFIAEVPDVDKEERSSMRSSIRSSRRKVMIRRSLKKAASASRANGDMSPAPNG